MRSLAPSRRRHQRGFALLLVFAMAAAIALMLYKELPRAVFESQRAKEEMLVERGDEYKMGFKRFYQKFRKFPQSMDELDNTNGQRFLRRRYKDPFTGKDEWKLIKMDAAGNLIDSVQSKKSATDKDDKKGGTGSVSLGYSLGDAGNQTGAGEGPNAATQRRASDQGIGADLAMRQYQQREQAEPSGPPPATPDQQQGTVVQMPQQQPGMPAMPGMQGQPGLPQIVQQIPGGGINPRMPQIPGMPAGFPQQGPLPIPPGLNLPGMVPQQPGQQTGQQPGGGMAQPGLGSSSSGMAQPGLGSSSMGQTGPMPGNPNGARVSFTPGQGFPSGIGVAGPQPAGGSAAPASAINSIMGNLTNPQRGMQVGQPGMFGAGGIVGVASKYKAEGIKLIEERSKINEWEFIYDPRKDKRITGQAGGGLSNAPAGGLPSGTQPGNSNLNGGSGFGGSSSSTTRK